MPQRQAGHILEQEFLVARSKILELAAIFDRIERAPGTVAGANQMDLLSKGIALLGDSTSDKAKQIQLLFSRQYDPAWRKTMNV